MKKRLFFLPLLALAQPVAAQHTELVGRFGLGLFQFSGPDANGTSFINYSDFRGYDSGYTNSPYGSRMGTGFALGGRAQRVGRHQGLLAFDLGYDWLRSGAGRPSRTSTTAPAMLTNGTPPTAPPACGPKT